MANSEFNAFESHFGISPPHTLLTLLSDDVLRRITPVAFDFKHVAFVLEIQHWLDIADPTNLDVANQRVAFAVTTDGFRIHANLANSALDIVQEEFGGFDNIGVTIYDLLIAERRQL